MSKAELLVKLEQCHMCEIRCLTCDNRFFLHYLPSGPLACPFCKTPFLLIYVQAPTEAIEELVTPKR